MPRIQIAKDLLPVSDEGRLLDLGCGDGSVLASLCEGTYVLKLFGVDINQSNVQKAKRRGIEAVVLDLNSASLPWSADSFDIVVMLEVMEHLINPDNALREAHRVLTSEGHLLLSIPNLASWANRLELLMGRQPYDLEYSTEIVQSHSLLKMREDFIRPVGHIRGYTPWALKGLLRYHGFKIDKLKGAPGPRKGSRRGLHLVATVFSKFPSLATYLVVLSHKSPTN